jgi:CxxC motif-containing protein (DUF1111 family)
MKTQKTYKFIFLIASFTFFLFACSTFQPLDPAEEDLLDGPIEGLSKEENVQFLKGDAAVNEIFTAASGLGSVFVASNCISCHAGDGKGTLFTTLTRFGQTDSTGNKYLSMGGPQLQNRAIQGFKPETIPAGATFSKFTPPAITGLGYLQFVTDQAIIKMSDPNDTNGDGITGVPNWIEIPSTIPPNPNAISRNGKYIGRFGKKASAYDLLHQTVLAYNQDMGITSVFDPYDTYSGLEIDPEVSTQKINEVVTYLKTLKAPIQRQKDDTEILKGKSIFENTNCGLCHVSELKTGFSPTKSLSNKTFYPYTDLLLHDMGSGLDDSYTEGSAKTSEWRTAPLWGLGLSTGSQGGKYFLMHDGRAKSIEEAIELHGGEALKSKISYTKLPESDKMALIRFLKSL